MHSLLLFLLLPTCLNAQGWKIDQPHKYIVINGDYIKLPVEERETENPSFLSSLNPMNAFQNFWSSLNFLKSDDSDHLPAGVPSGSDFEQTAASAPSGITVPFSNYFSNPTSSFPSLGHLFSGGGVFMKRSANGEAYPGMGSPSHRINKRSTALVSKEKNHPKGPVRYVYKPVGQGGFIRYEIPILTPEELAAEEQERAAKNKAKNTAKNSSPLEMSAFGGYKEHVVPPYSPFVYKNFNPKHKPEDTKQYQYYEHFPYGSLPYPTASSPGGPQGNGMTMQGTETKETEDPFPCPKVGFWTYNAGMCTATHANPPWSCKPIDLVQSGKLVLCRNEVYYSY